MAATAISSKPRKRFTASLQQVASLNLMCRIELTPDVFTEIPKVGSTITHEGQEYKVIATWQSDTELPQ